MRTWPMGFSPLNSEKNKRVLERNEVILLERIVKYIEQKYDGRFRLHGFYPYSILGDTRPEKLYCACLWKYHNPDGSPAFEGLVNPKKDFDALIAEGVHPWVGASIRTIEDMKHAVSLGAELITSNEPAFMISELKKAGLRVKE